MNERHLTPPPGLTELPTYLASRAGLLGRRLVTEAVEGTGMRVPHYGVLACVAAHGPISQRDLAGRLGLDASDVVSLVDELEALGLVERHRDTQDRRRYAITVTSAGADSFQTARVAAQGAQDEFLGPLDPAQRESLTDALLAILAAHDPRYEGVER